MIVDATRKTYPGPLIVGEDLMRFVIADDVKMMKWELAAQGLPDLTRLGSVSRPDQAPINEPHPIHRTQELPDRL